MRAHVSHFADWHHYDPAVMWTVIMGIVAGTVLATAF
jgi:hypothetical protein